MAIQIDVPPVASGHEAFVLMAHHYMLASAYYDAADTKMLDELLVRLNDNEDKPDRLPMLAWITAMGEFFAQLDAAEEGVDA